MLFRPFYAPSDVIRCCNALVPDFDDYVAGGDAFSRRTAAGGYCHDGDAVDAIGNTELTPRGMIQPA